MPLDMQVLNSLFQAARELNPEERKQYLDEVCGTDATMRKQLEDMLDAHHEHRTPTPQGPTLADPQFAPLNNAHLNLKPGDILENTYQIIEMISQGGMGAVYRAARIADMKMEVAIKVIKPSLAAPQTLARFNNEKHALAIMKHENIARVLDAGTTPGGLPFFVMELVKGVSITQYCDDNKLTVRERLELFIPVCEAIQHAHLKGVVHRDLKPSNILVALYDEKAVPKIIDFGLAKALHQPLTDEIIHTGFKTFVGTYQYAAPEQAKLNNLDIDTRADIYSLGVVLYELLTGAPTLSKERITKLVFDEVLRAIREEEPPKPSTKIGSSDKLPSLAALRRCEPVKLKQQIQGEIDWIVMKALEKERGRRFESANAFAADLRRYLAGEAVQSGPASWRYRAGKYLKKHRGKVIAGGLLAAAILVGSVVSTIGWITASRERARADEQVEITQAVNDFLLKDLLSEADPNEQIKPGQPFISNITVKTSVDRAAALVAKRFAKKPIVEAAVRHTLGKTYLGLGDLHNARIQLEKAEQLHRDTLGSKDQQTLSTQYTLGLLYMELQQFDKAQMLLNTVVNGQKNLHGIDHRETLKTQYILALLHVYLDSVDVARSLYDDTLIRQTRLLGNRDRDTIITQRQFAFFLHMKGETDKAESMNSEALKLSEEELGPENPQTLIARSDRASILENKGQLEEAQRLLENVYVISKKFSGADDPSTLKYEFKLAINLLKQGRLNDAMKALTLVIPRLKRTFGATAHDTLGAIQCQAVCLVELMQYDKAEELLLEVLQECLKIHGEKHSNTITVVSNLAQLFKRSGNKEKASNYEALYNKLSK